MRYRRMLPMAAAALALAGSASADETTFCNTYITAVPYTITTQGHYCFDRNLSTAITAGAAITIENNVLDGNTVAGINVFATNYLIRNNQVYKTGGTTSTVVRHCQVNPPYVTGISTIGGATFGECIPDGVGEIIGNTVAYTTPVPGGAGASIDAPAGIVIENRVIGQSAGPAIVAAVCRDNTAHSISDADPYLNCDQLVGINSDY